MGVVARPRASGQGGDTWVPETVSVSSEDGMDVAYWWNHLMVDLRDPRADSFPGMFSIWPTIVICGAYVYIVKVLGPRFMENREPYNIKKILLVYNFAQTVFSFWMFCEGWQFYVSGNYSWHCEPVDYSDSPVAIRAINLAWFYYFSKFIDLFDSFFFIARKKFGHLSALHVIHHSTLPILCWWGPRFVGGGQSGFGPFLNSGVHTLMYLYYLLAAAGPAMQPYLWWKKYLTTIQLVQFVWCSCTPSSRSSSTATTQSPPRSCSPSLASSTSCSSWHSTARPTPRPGPPRWIRTATPTRRSSTVTPPPSTTGWTSRTEA